MRKGAPPGAPFQFPDRSITAKQWSHPVLYNPGPSPPQESDKPSSLFDWRQYLAIHPAAELFPLMKDMDPAGFKDHVEDIRAHGIIEPIVGWGSNEGVS